IPDSVPHAHLLTNTHAHTHTHTHTHSHTHRHTHTHTHTHIPLELGHTLNMSFRNSSDINKMKAISHPLETNTVSSLKHTHFIHTHVIHTHTRTHTHTHPK